jgi:hypothetical protein
MFNNDKEESAHLEQEVFDERVNQEVERRVNDYLDVQEIESVDFYLVKDDSIVMEINGNGITVTEQMLARIVDLGSSILQDCDHLRDEENAHAQQWADQEDEEPNPYSGTYSEI